MPSSPLTIDVISDVVCPWCYIGKRRLEAALALVAARRRGAVTPLVRWHPFQLNPDLPREGIDRRAYLEAKFGGAAARGADLRARARGGPDGRHRVRVRAHRAPAQHARRASARSRGRRRAATPEALVERLFRAYFLEGRDRRRPRRAGGDRRRGGLRRDGRARVCSPPTRAPTTIAAMPTGARASSASTGVPFFIFDGRVAVSGAQEPQTLLDAMARGDRAEPTAVRTPRPTAATGGSPR